MHFPPLYFVAGALLVGLLIEAVIKRDKIWMLPSAFLYFTIFGWYFADLFIAPDNYEFIPSSVLDFAYIQVIGFLVTYRLAVVPICRRLSRGATRALAGSKPVDSRKLFVGAVVLWAVLMCYGTARMDGDVIGAFLPLDGRTGMSMWSRAAAGDAGPTGFIISSATYIHLLLSATFGVWWFFLRSSRTKWVVVAMVILSWPYFLLCGTRSVFLAVSMPTFLAFLLFARYPLVIRLVCLAVAFIVVESALRVVIDYRDVGFRELMAGRQAIHFDEDKPRHEGLNMIQELCYTNGYASTHEAAYGTRYLLDLTNMIPRAIWPSKPMLNLDYNIWRGFEGGDSDMGLVATMSSGIIGGGVLNFGMWLGPIAPAVLMALWSGLLSRWWCQRASFPRCFLSLIGMGLIFNLGRDITLLVLWPIVFGYILVRVVEKIPLFLVVGRKVPRNNVRVTAPSTGANEMSLSTAEPAKSSEPRSNAYAEHQRRRRSYP